MEKKTLTEYDYTRKRVLVLTPRQAELLKLKEGDEASGATVHISKKFPPFKK